jgi:hypothetical protein
MYGQVVMKPLYPGAALFILPLFDLFFAIYHYLLVLDLLYLCCLLVRSSRSRRRRFVCLFFLATLYSLLRACMLFASHVFLWIDAPYAHLNIFNLISVCSTSGDEWFGFFELGSRLLNFELLAYLSMA